MAPEAAQILEALTTLIALESPFLCVYDAFVRLEVFDAAEALGAQLAIRVLDPVDLFVRCVTSLVVVGIGAVGALVNEPTILLE